MEENYSQSEIDTRDNNHEYVYPPSVDEDDKIVGKILTRRQALSIGGLSSLGLLVGCGGGATSTSTGTGPTITTQPSSQTVALGSSVTFTVIATGDSLSYQWYKGGTSINGATASSYSIAATVAGDAGSYHVVVTNSTGSVTSNSATLTISSGLNLVATPTVTERPFFVDENLNRLNLLSGTTRTTIINGIPFTVTFTLYALSGTTATPLEGAHVDLWHCDTIGVYSDEASGSIQSENTVGQTWLRGYQVTDSSGVVSFQTIYPGWYTGRTIHFHVKIRTYDSANNKTHEFTTQMFFDDTVSDEVQTVSPYRTGRTVYNSNDNVYSVSQADGTKVGSYLMLNMSGSTSAGFTGTFNLAFNFG